jgi:outer membrane lipoprotein-sorting protein
LGGMAAIEKISSRMVKGTLSGMGGHSFEQKSFYKVPDQSVVITRFPNGEAKTVYDGHEGWQVFPGRPLRPLEGADLDAVRMDGDIHLPAHLTGTFSSFKVAPPEMVGGREAFHILGLRTGLPPVELYFDEQSGLLARQLRYAESPLGLYPTQIDYADYRDQDGVKIPFQITTSRPGSSSTLQVEEVRQNVVIDEAIFTKPQAPDPSVKR